MDSKKLNEDTVGVLKDMGIESGDITGIPDISSPVKEMADDEKVIKQAEMGLKNDSEDNGGAIHAVEPIEIDPEDPVQKLASDTEDFPAMKEGGKEGPLFDIYQRTNMAEMRPYIDGEDMSAISVADVDTPGIGGMVARNPSNHDDQWYVAQEYFEDNFAPIFDHEDLEKLTQEKTLKNSDVPDLTVFGDGDMFKLLCKASSDLEGWMKSTKAMEIPGVGCVVQVTTQQGGNIAEALTFVPGTRIIGNAKKGRQIVKL